MLFLEDFSQVSCHLADDFTVDVQFSPYLNLFLLVSPSAVSLWTSNLIEPELKSSFILTEKMKELGLLTASSFINKTSFACLTSSGSILLFQIDSKLKISFQKQLEIKSKPFFTSISSYNGFVVAGDNKGNFSLLSSESIDENFVSSLTFKLAQWPLKKLAIGVGYGIALCADGSVILFEVDRKILTDPEYEIKSKVLIESGASLICASTKSQLFCIYQAAGQRFTITNNDFHKTIEHTPQMSSICFANDGKTVFCATKDGFLAWSLNCQRFRYLANKDVGNARVISLSDQLLIASIEKGVAVLPILTAPMSHSPLLYGVKKIVEARATTGGCISIQHPCPLVGDILSCASDESDRLIAVVGTEGVALFAKATANWHRPVQPNRQILHVDFMGRTLCLTAHSKKDSKYSLILAKSSVSTDLEIVKSIQLPGKPLAMRASHEACAIAIGKAVIQIDALFVLSIAKLSCEAIACEPISPTQAIALLKNGKLVLVNPSTSKEKVTTQNESLLKENVSSFFIDQTNKIIFAHMNFSMYAAKVSDLKFVKIYESEDIPIGVNSNLFALITIEPGSSLPLHPNLAHFINPELINDEKAYQAIRNSRNAQNILIQIVVHMIRSGNSERIVPFLKNFPEYYKQVLIAALRTSEPPERAGILKVLGSATEIFAQVANANYEKKEIPIFNKNEEIFSEDDLKLSSLLLEVIMQEDGPVAALSAALFIADNMKEIPDDLQRAMNIFICAVNELKLNSDGIKELLKRGNSIINSVSSNNPENPVLQ